MVIDERSDRDRVKQQRKTKRPVAKGSSTGMSGRDMKILGTVQIIENDSTEVCTVEPNDEVSIESGTQIHALYYNLMLNICL